LNNGKDQEYLVRTMNIIFTDSKNPEDYITEEERKQLLSALQAKLFWVGQRIPNHIEIQGKDYRLHDYVWKLCEKDALTVAENSTIDKFIELILEKEKEDAKNLAEKQLMEKDAINLFHETAGLLRAIVDLKEIEDGTMRKSAEHFQELYGNQRVNDAKRWLEFIKNSSG
jgi:hypothetical protein